jgi:TorA maturation chaperone TorD
MVTPSAATLRAVLVRHNVQAVRIVLKPVLLDHLCLLLRHCSTLASVGPYSQSSLAKAVATAKEPFAIYC